MIVTLSDRASLEVPEEFLEYLSSHKKPAFVKGFFTRLKRVVRERTKAEVGLDILGNETRGITFFAQQIGLYFRREDQLLFGITEPSEYAPIVLGKKGPLRGGVKPLNEFDLDFKVNGASCEVVLSSDVLLKSRITQFNRRYGAGVANYAPHATPSELHLLETFFGYER
ncbi:hypothetical protein HN592_03065 [Candidatus Woesearchaeota archaeon]|jgi:hypothetical protein|nr:hypothetical protein [Candidatus Woesearchaeota archaeon]MBT4368194.1 hypothetical protein [Candidatus Woesearchaeota archaeon]MBT4712682.1 hypothetical protein [Candidatus Woesearchaeota archaeon]MBT6639595.1 hypothetical protein [Candidatus Woesearchaeota archaeon]MBT7133767.1 hypothetical protein [Candidatus Woesearchaeota archaeon]